MSSTLPPDLYCSEECRLIDESVWANITDLAGRVRLIEKMIDTKDSPWWRRLLWRVDGWPAWYRVGPRGYRPWHR